MFDPNVKAEEATTQAANTEGPTAQETEATEGVEETGERVAAD